MAETNPTIPAAPTQPLAIRSAMQGNLRNQGRAKWTAIVASRACVQIAGLAGLIKYLVYAEERAQTQDEEEGYSFCRRLVSLALEGWPHPYVAAFYYHYGRHPKKLIPEWLRSEAKDRRLDIPDYDPLSESAQQSTNPVIAPWACVSNASIQLARSARYSARRTGKRTCRPTASIAQGCRASCVA